ncbi:ATPase [Catellatospora sp. TT07R-123]|uniref:ATP-binding protein n=1 Tax=Catellatospora sp. TT07R-123 TaxID=2733863 RepID=UPI001B1F26D6|nr:ATP-binding protein [Catellatospora sp. TT07R-123]GHJ48788.1 ATPase [Catellatospora sp. TT07R-123]
MNEDDRSALSCLRFDVAPVPDDVWRSSPFHVEALHGEVAGYILDGLADAERSADGSPMGVAMQGQAGSGKTHLLGWVREQTQLKGGYFFLVGLLDGGYFWKSTALAFLDGLYRPYREQRSQLAVFLDRLCEQAGVGEQARAAIGGNGLLERGHVDEFVGALRRHHQPVGMACHHTARALVLLAAGDPTAQDVGYAYLQSMEELEQGERHAWGIHPEPKLPQLVVQEISQLLALTGPAVVAVDQLDTLIAQAVTDTSGGSAGDESQDQIMLVNRIADGLMSLRQTTRRTLTVLSCLPSTWTLIRTQATKSVADRFREAVTLKGIASADIARDIVEKRFAVRFAEIGYVPEYPSWPVLPEAFAYATVMTPRRLINTINDHVQSCLRRGVVRELESLLADGDSAPPVVPVAPQPPGDDVLEARFTQLKQAADISGALRPSTEDSVVRELLEAGLAAWIEEQGRFGGQFKLDPPQGGKVALHARLRRILDETVEDEQHWSFRAVSAEQPIAALARIHAARTGAGLSRGITKRKLFLLRNEDWNKGPKTQEALKAFTEDGGAWLKMGEDDLRTFAALRQLLAERDPGLAAWLVSRRPAGRTMLLRTVLGEVAAELAQVEQAAEAEPAEPAADAAATGGESAVIALGTGYDDGLPLHLQLEWLRKHTVIFAGSGSGKTVLIRRLIEECALQGVSTIVLDPNNDLARLGDAWPQPPSGWLDGDAARAAEFLDGTDVVVWTPNRDAGRPVSFQPLPDFRSVLGDPDELAISIAAAVASLAPRAKVDGNTVKAELARAVLKESLTAFARTGGGGLKQFLDLLSELPEGLSQIDDAERIGFGLAQTLRAATVNDPLFGGDGAPVDPGLLLTPAPGKRARISVVSFVGLPSDEQRQSFVNQLQMALFAWIKKNPAGERPLGGLFVMDEAQTLAPSGPMTACTRSTLALASQARKYGLGLVFATQQPKGLHNGIPGNAATQFFGLLNAPVQIDAAREMARAKGADVPDIARLGTGEFYASGEGFAFRKVRTPLCLSHHPKSPLTTEEVVDRARAARD